MNPGENRSINAVRTVAAVLVVMEHVRALVFQDWADVAHTPLNAAFYFLTGLGTDAVVIFFVLSGFWVGGSVLQATGRGTFRWRDYLISRGARLWIALVPAVLLTVLLASIGLTVFSSTDIFGGHPGYHSLVNDNIGADISPGVVVGNLFFLQGIAVPVIGTNGPLWSLAYEFWYYVLFPVFLIALTRGSVKRRLIHGVVGVAVAALVGADILALFPVWLLGVAVAHFKTAIMALLTRLGGRIPLLRFGTGLLLVTVVALTDIGGLPVPISAWVVAIPAALFISTLVLDSPMKGPWFAPLRGAAYYAQASYSLYVTHLPVAIFACAMSLPFASSRHHPSPPMLIAYAASVVALMGVGWVFAWLTEFRTPTLRRVLDRLVPGRRSDNRMSRVPSA